MTDITLRVREILNLFLSRKKMEGRREKVEGKKTIKIWEDL